jgi:hypothetical protein
MQVADYGQAELAFALKHGLAASGQVIYANSSDSAGKYPLFLYASRPRIPSMPVEPL